MNKLILGMSAATLLASAAYANEGATTSLDTSPAAFSKLDMDQDGRVSAIEAANDSQLAAAFTKADVDQDGYLSASEFQGAEASASEASPNSAPSDEPMPSDTVPQQ